MCTSHRLQVILRVEVAIIEYHGVSGREVEALPAGPGTQQEHKRVCDVVEFTDRQVTFFRSYRPVQTLIRVVCRRTHGDNVKINYTKLVGKINTLCRCLKRSGYINYNITVTELLTDCNLGLFHNIPSPLHYLHHILLSNMSSLARTRS